MASSPTKRLDPSRCPPDTKRLECVKEFIKAARSNKFSTLRKLSSNDKDVFDVWDNVSQLIEYHMRRQKAVHIPGLGSFTFTTSKLDVGHNKFILIQRPVFVLSEKLVRTHRLTQSRYHVPGEIPVIQLNFTALSYELNLDRDLVDASIKEVVSALSRKIEQSRSCEFAFTTIGNLIIANGVAKMRFLPSFLEKMGQREESSCLLESRPDTVDKAIVLPKIQPGNDISISSPTNKGIDIFNHKENDTLYERNKDLLDVKTFGDGTVSPREFRSSKHKAFTLERNESPKEIGSVKLNDSSPSERKFSREVGSPKSNHGRTNIASTSLGSKNTELREQSASDIKKHSVIVRDPRKDCEPRQSNSFGIPRKISTTALLNLLQNKPIATSPKNNIRTLSKKTEEKCDSCSDHSTDFCYLCFQREQRNIPIYFKQERKKEDDDEDRLLQAYTLLQDKEALQQNQEQKQKKREIAQAIAAFNLSVAEELKTKQNVRPSKFERSYVFRNRCVTPPHFIKQEDYQEDLAQQVSEKKKRHEVLKRDQNNIERVEQMKLADELAAQWEDYLRNKRLKSDSYRKALDAQVLTKKRIDDELEADNCERRRTYFLPQPNIVFPFQKNVRISTNPSNMMAYRSSELPAAYPDSVGPIFGLCDTDDKKRMERRKRAQLLYQNQLEMAAKKRELAMVHGAKVKKEEEELLRKTKAELLEETLVRNTLNLQQRKELERTWAINDMKKKAKELEERLRARSPGLLLQEQCDKYANCNQCTRKQTNYGRSNVWSESRYVSGSRLMV